MLLKICGNCKTYKYDNDPSKKGGCSKTNTVSSPLAIGCDDFNSKKR